MTQFQTLPDNVSPSHHCTAAGREKTAVYLCLTTRKSESKCTLDTALKLAWLTGGEVEGYKQPRLKTREGNRHDMTCYITSYTKIHRTVLVYYRTLLFSLISFFCLGQIGL